jgi:hypothetical protein
MPIPKKSQKPNPYQQNRFPCFVNFLNKLQNKPYYVPDTFLYKAIGNTAANNTASIFFPGTFHPPILDQHDNRAFSFLLSHTDDMHRAYGDDTEIHNLPLHDFGPSHFPLKHSIPYVVLRVAVGATPAINQYAISAYSLSSLLISQHNNLSSHGRSTSA